MRPYDEFYTAVPRFKTVSEGEFVEFILNYPRELHKYEYDSTMICDYTLTRGERAHFCAMVAEIAEKDFTDPSSGKEYRILENLDEVANSIIPPVDSQPSCSRQKHDEIIWGYISGGQGLF